eukprot:CAMPEP_0183477954 /NCGR_PEP_ID=MMETSP0370-20130417/169072_1 /TAXON_ID=268820 /ORGANISM="Peridinium aciculiferum, Strain PAER-2" /LENGTH=114 /DNA_ID=CAMNT_0025670887 /DNA_START=116 /DNA_END=457 /DNA_ORIENTATION=-
MPRGQERTSLLDVPRLRTNVRRSSHSTLLVLLGAEGAAPPRRCAVKKMSPGALVPSCSSKLTVLRPEDEHAVARAEDNCDPTGVIVPALQTAEVAELSVRASSTSELLSLSLSL